MPSHALTRRRRKLRLSFAAAAVAGALALTACAAESGPGAEPAGDPVAGGDIVFALGQDTQILDPQLTNNSTTGQITRQLVDSLVAQAEDASYHPWLAESWAVNEDNTEFVFTLRDDVTFSDGAEFNADAAKANLERILDPNVNSSYARSLLGPISSVDVTGEFEVAISYDEPFATLLQGLSLPFTGMVSPEWLATDPSPAEVVGSGPFVLESFTPGTGAKLVKREDYAWGPGFAENRGAAYLDSIDFQILPESSVRLGALTSGQVDAIDGVPPSGFAQLEANEQFQLLSFEYPGVTNAMFLNSERAPFDDERVRRAFQSSFDTAAVVQAAWRGSLGAADNILSKNTPHYDSTTAGMWGFDLDEANALLDDAGWTTRDADGYRVKNGERLTVTYIVSNLRPSEDVTLAQAIQAEVKDAGFELVLEVAEPGIATARLGEGDYDLYQLYFIRPEADILRTAFHSASLPPNGNNAARVTQLDDALREGMGAADERRAELYSEVQQHVIGEAFVVPLYVPAAQVGVTSALQGVTWATNGKPQFYDAWLSR